MVARPSRQLPIAHVLQHAADGRYANRDLVLRMQPTDQITQAPTNNAIQIGDRTVLDNPDQSRPLCCVQTCWSARGLPVNQPFRAFGIKPQNPVPNALYINICMASGLTTRTAVIDQSKGKKPPGLFAV